MREKSTADFSIEVGEKEYPTQITLRQLRCTTRGSQWHNNENKELMKRLLPWPQQV